MSESFTEDRLALALELHGDQAARIPTSALLEDAPWVTGLGTAVGKGRRRRFVLLRGDPHVEATVADVRFRSHVESFFQANRFLVDELVGRVAEMTPAGGTVLDLYAGVGLFALTLARQAERVLAAEWNAWAVEDAKANARRAGLGHVRIHRESVGEALASWPVSRDERIILDPPRSGAGPELAGTLAARRPAAIVYVSCDPTTLARDLKIFDARGYRLDRVEAFDLFPDTFHLETIALLRPR
jgi:23S rRNA (uracil1939-C5)-methyltransferase